MYMLVLLLHFLYITEMRPFMGRIRKPHKACYLKELDIFNVSL